MLILVVTSLGGTMLMMMNTEHIIAAKAVARRIGSTNASLVADLIARAEQESS